MYNYNSVRQWHLNYDSTVPPTSLVEEDVTAEDAKTAITEITFHRNYIKQKLDNGLVRMWRVRTREGSGVFLIVRNYNEKKSKVKEKRHTCMLVIEETRKIIICCICIFTGCSTEAPPIFREL